MGLGWFHLTSSGGSSTFSTCCCFGDFPHFQTCKQTSRCCSRTQEALPHLQHPQVQVDAAKHVDNLQLRVLNKMLRSIFRSSRLLPSSWVASAPPPDLPLTLWFVGPAPPPAAAASPRPLPPASAHAARARANTHWRIFEGPMKVVRWFLSWVWAPAGSW